MPPTETSKYMKSEYETPPGPYTGGSMIAAMTHERQVAIQINGNWVPARDYQNAAVLYFAEEMWERIDCAKKLIEEGGAKLDPVFWTFKAPQGGTFKIVDKRPADQEFGFTLRREDGTESFCLIHHGNDSEKICGVKMDKWPIGE